MRCPRDAFQSARTDYPSRFHTEAGRTFGYALCGCVMVLGLAVVVRAADVPQPAPQPSRLELSRHQAFMSGDEELVELFRTAAVPVTDSAKPAVVNTSAEAGGEAGGATDADRAHAACFEDGPFPSARRCKECHPDHYREWSVSPHAYALLSPVFNAMSNTLNVQTNGTLGDFCIRCHTPIGMAMSEPINASAVYRHPVSREGVTCAVCHRINQRWGKVSARQSLVVGGLTQPIYGPTGNHNLEAALADPEKYGKLKTSPDDKSVGRSVHREVIPFFEMTTPGFCGSCHDVLAPNGFHLEDAFSEYKVSPAAKKEHVTCQDCHMGVEPGVPAGYAFEPIAKVGNVTTPPRKRTNHMFVGPDYSIVHPGIFPHHPDLVRETHPDFQESSSSGLATIDEWLQFDPRAGWGTPDFERAARSNGYTFPKPWQDAARRYRARDLLDKQLELLREADAYRLLLLRHGYRLGPIRVERNTRKKLQFHVRVSNGTTGHSVPTGFDADRLVFLRVMVWDANGRLVFVSGDLDPNGDIRDSHSLYVHNGELPLDRQVFSLQSRFLTRNLRGGEREQVLNTPYSLDPLPFLRPETRPFSVLGRPTSARKHKQNIEVNGHRKARYVVKSPQLTGCHPYQIQVQLVAGMVPVNLVHEVSHTGFDFGMTAREVADAIVEGHQVIHERTAPVPSFRSAKR